MKKYLIFLLFILSSNNYAENIEFQSVLSANNNLLVVHTGHGDSHLNYCNSDFFNRISILNNYVHFSLYFDLFYLNNQLIPEQYLKFLESKLNIESFNKVVLLNINYTRLSGLHKPLSDMYSIGFKSNSFTPDIVLTYDFDKLFNFLNKLNLNISSDLYYFTTRSSLYDIKNNYILTELKKHNQFSIHQIQIKSVSELRHKLIELNKISNPAILMFNIDYLYSDIHAKLIPITDVLIQIRNYNRGNIPVNLSLLCSTSKNLLVLNLAFDYHELVTKLNTLLLDGVQLELASELIISLKQMYALQLDSNLESNEYLHLFDGISKLY